MIKPEIFNRELPMQVANGKWSTTTKVWAVLSASYTGDLETLKALVAECPELIYAQYNYAPPIHFAVREGHIKLVKYLLDNGAHDSGYRIYPFQESLEIVAADRGFTEILVLLEDYAQHPERQKYSGDNGSIDCKRTPLQTEFERAVDQNNISRVAEILKDHPEFAFDTTYFWDEGILLFAAKENNREMIELLMSYGATVPKLLKWTKQYYFERYPNAVYMMQKGMDPNTMSYQHVTILHDMAWTGQLDKAKLLMEYGAHLNPIDEAYQSTPLGLAARWGQTEMVEYLLAQGADPNLSGAVWSTPLAWSTRKGHAEIVEMLVKTGAK